MAVNWGSSWLKWFQTKLFLATWWELGEKQIEKITRMTQLCGLSGLFCLQLWENSLMLSLQTTESTWGVIAEVEATHITSSICFLLGKKASRNFFRCNSKMIALKLSLTCWRKTGRPPYWGGKSPIHIRVLKAHEPQQKILNLHCSHRSGTCNQIIQAFYCFYRLDPISPVFCVCFNVHQWNSNN